VPERNTVCPACERDNRADAWFCDRCGRSLVAPGGYTPPHLAQRILTSRFALEGERKQVTVLFADLEGSVARSERLDPETWHRTLDRFFQILAEGVHRFEGTVNQFTGDGIMALFGAPIAHEDHARRACWAALWLARALARERRRGLDLPVRMGLNSGDVVVGKIGDDLRMDYTAQGLTVALAQRVEELAEPGHVLMTGATAGLVRGFFELADRGETDLKGVSAPVRVLELTGTGPLRTRLDASRARGFASFIGRDAELATLEAALASAQNGDARVVAVSGEAGVGKSRLCLEFVESLRARGIPVFEAHCPSHAQTLPLFVIRELLRSSLELAEEEAEPRERIEASLALLGPGVAHSLPLVLGLLGVPGFEGAIPADPATRHDELADLLRRWVQARSSLEPVVLLVDDAHWLDAESDALLAELVEALGWTRTLLVVNCRPEYRPSWTGASYFTPLALGPLDESAESELLRALLGEDPSLAELLPRIHARARGNPFFAEEVVQDLADARRLRGAPGSYRLSDAPGELKIPASVRAVLAARIDRLPEVHKHVLCTAAAIGSRFEAPLLERVAELEASPFADALATLVELELLAEESLVPEASYVFAHPLTHEVAYGSPLREHQERVHASIARALEELHAEQLGTQADRIAHHWEQAGRTYEGRRWRHRAALRVARIQLRRKPESSS
jgi:class 3 adenylate cyclase